MPRSAEELTAAAMRAAAARSLSQVFVYEDGFLFSCDGMESSHTERFTGTVLLATTDEDLEIEVDGRRQRVGIALLKPFLAKTLLANKVPFVSLGVNPAHPRYRAFSNIDSPGYVAVPRTLFPDLRTTLQALQSQRLSLSLPDSRRVFEQCVDTVLGLLPALKPMDPRIARVMAVLGTDHRQSLDELADLACLSYHRMSHLFSEEMGLSLRQYVLSLKIQSACRCIASGMNLTDTAHAAGFTDSAHLSRVWTKAFGGPPSHFLEVNRFSIQPSLGSAARTHQQPEPADTQY